MSVRKAFTSFAKMLIYAHAIQTTKNVVGQNNTSCVFGELMTRCAILTGDVEADQLRLIFELTGRPDAALTEKFRQLPDWEKCAAAQHPVVSPVGDTFSSKFRGVDPGALNLLKAMLHLDPQSRISATSALEDPYFQACPPSSE